MQVLLLDELADIYDAESRLTKMLLKMVYAATHAELREAFEAHLEETENHVIRLRDGFQSLGENARGRKCEAIVGLLKEPDEVAANNKGSLTINAALVCAAQEVEHYEIATIEAAQDGEAVEADAPRASSGRTCAGRSARTKVPA